MDNCDFCLEKKRVLADTRNGKRICGSCASIFHFCEICGSVAADTNPDSQLHYDELCFK